MAKSLRSYPQSFLLFAFIDALTAAFLSSGEWGASKGPGNYEKYRQTVYRFRRNGYLQISQNPAGQKFLKLTKKGELQLLAAKAWLPRREKWDGKWRLIMFDIPKGTRGQRDKLRRLLKKADFFKLQASVYITPHPLNRDAVSYLKSTGLIGYIRMGRLEELDDDQDLKKHFKL